MSETLANAEPSRTEEVSAPANRVASGARAHARFRVGLVGTGAISEHHALGIGDAPEAELVGVYDIDAGRAEEAARRFGVPCFQSIRAMCDAGVQVVHVLTPAGAHADVALEALDLGCHVFVEKPLADDVERARAIVDAARRAGLVATVNHSVLFDPQMRRAMALVRSGKLGRVVSVDILRSSTRCKYEGGPLPPHYRDAGYAFRDLGIHSLYLLRALLGPIEDVQAQWTHLGGEPNLAFDEWRAVVRCKGGIGQFQISYNVKPIQNQLIIQGTRAMLRVDFFSMFLARRSSTPLPKAAERVVNAVTDSLQPLLDVPLNTLRFVTGRIRPFQGLRTHIREFYRALASGQPPPIDAEEGLEVVYWTEKVARDAAAEHAGRTARFHLSTDVPVLVTGASGYLGRAVTQRLVESGSRVRMLVRRPPDRVPPGVEVALGNLGDPEAVARAVRGAQVVVHAGAAISGSPAEQRVGTVLGTRNVLEACERFGVQKLVHISSMSVVERARASGGQPIDEVAALEPRAAERGLYTQTKLEAEQLVSAAVREGRVRAVILRPGQLFGRGVSPINGAIARRIGGRWLVLGDGELQVSLVHVDDVVDAVTASMRSELESGEIVQLVDPAGLTQNDVLQLVDSGRRVIRIPRSVVFAAGKLSEPFFALLRRGSPISSYRMRSALASLRFRSRNAEALLGWQPRVGVRRGILEELGKAR